MYSPGTKAKSYAALCLLLTYAKISAQPNCTFAVGYGYFPPCCTGGQRPAGPSEPQPRYFTRELKEQPEVESDVVQFVNRALELYMADSMLYNYI